MSIEIGIGSSAQADVFAAGQEAARESLQLLGGQKPDAMLVFSSIRFADPRMLKAVRTMAPEAVLVGCTDAGGIITAGPKRRSITVVSLKVTDGTCVAAVERQMSQRPQAAGISLAESLLRQAKTPGACMLVFQDGLSASGSEVLSGIEKRLSRSVPVAGASAADDLYFQRTFQFFNNEILTDAVVGLLITGQVNVGIGVRHGWVPVGRPRKVTRSSGHIIHQLDNRPAVAIYEEFLGLQRSELSEENLAHVTLSYPLGREHHGHPEYLLRDALRVGKNGALICSGEVPQGSEVRLMIGGYEAALEAAQQAACEAREALGRTRLKGALVFCSVARQKMLGSEFQGEIDVIRDALGGAGVHMGGFYSYGEMASSAKTGGKSGSPHFQNESVVVVALG